MARNLVVDVAKGIGILLVVAMHSGIGYLPAVDMPLFFFISGFFAPRIDKYTLEQAFFKRSRGLLGLTFLYILFFSFIGPTIQNYNSEPSSGFFQWFTIQHLIIEPLFSTPLQPLAGPLWFVPTLWFINLLWLATRPYIEESFRADALNVIKIVCILLLLLNASVHGPMINESIGTGFISRVIYGYCFFCIGAIAYALKDFYMHKVSFKIFILVLACISLLIKYFSFEIPFEMDVRTMSFDDLGQQLSVLVSFSSISLIFLLSYILSKFRLTASIFVYLGNKSFHIMALHFIGLWLYHKSAIVFKYKILLDNPSLNGSLLFFAGLIFSVIAIMLMTVIKSFCCVYLSKSLRWAFAKFP